MNLHASNNSDHGIRWVQPLSAKSEFLRVKVIARRLGVCKKTIHRRAKREHWPRRINANRYEYAVPAGMMALARKARREVQIATGARPKDSRRLDQLAKEVRGELQRLLQVYGLLHLIIGLSGKGASLDGPLRNLSGKLERIAR